MKRLLARHVMSEMTARRFAWCAAFVLGATCTALILKVLPEFGVWTSIGLVSGVALAWVMLGTHLPRMVVQAKP